ncbi:uncharacterized protein [Nicotiana tomentosiformis]|uniref:uncharacterized protein n=1 Tax=Nicotiana tomentosiformis TaxID=4098 RepID=UPI00388C4E9A
MDPSCSGHSPLSITLEEDEDHTPKQLKFLNHLADHKDFMTLVSEVWERSTEQNTMKDTWQKLKRVKQVMKTLNNTEYNAVGNRIKQCRQQLCDIQEQMQNPGQPEAMVEAEKDMKIQLEKLLGVKESIMKQKSRVKWLKLGDANTTYFFANIKSRYSQNNIRRLINGNGDIVQTKKGIEEEVTGFYQQLLGSPAVELPAINLIVMRDGTLVNSATITSSGRGDTVTNAVMKFFSCSNMYQPINCTTVTFVPKLLYKFFQDFSKASGLVANTNKSSIFFGEVNADMQKEILQVLGFSKGTLPVRYLGVPLSFSAAKEADPTY